MTENNDLPFKMYRLPEDFSGDYKLGEEISFGKILGFILCEQGKMEVVMHGEKYLIGPSSVFIMHVNANLFVKSISSDFKGMAIMAQPEYGIGIASKAIYPTSLIYFQNNPLLQFSPYEFSDVMAMLDKLKTDMDKMSVSEENPTVRPLRNEIIRCQVEMFIYKGIYIYLTNYMRMESITRNVNKVMQKFIVSINNNHRYHRDVAFYAKEQCLSPNYFSSIIKKETGLSALHCITMAVINDVKQLLGYSNLSIKEITAYFNFPNQSFFGKYFKQYAGVSPKDYREGKRTGDNRLLCCGKQQQAHLE
jgi:AraC-like DNA-binding protein